MPACWARTETELTDEPERGPLPSLVPELAVTDVMASRGMNLEITVPSIQPALRRLRSAPWPLFLEPEEKCYRKWDIEVGVVQFLVQDPDGYLLRLSQALDSRARWWWFDRRSARADTRLPRRATELGVGKPECLPAPSAAPSAAAYRSR